MTSTPAGPWRKSSYSDTGGQCVETARAGTAIAVRDSRNPGEEHLTVSPHAWTAFIRHIQHGK